MTRPALRLYRCLDSVDGDPALDTAVSRAVLQRVEAGELPATLRPSRPKRIVAFSSRDARAPSFGAPPPPRAGGASRPSRVWPVAAPRSSRPGPSPSPGRLPPSPPADGIRDRFAAPAEALRSAFGSLGADSRVGEVPGEYCPGEWSVTVGGTREVAGVGDAPAPSRHPAG